MSLQKSVKTNFGKRLLSIVGILILLVCIAVVVNALFGRAADMVFPAFMQPLQYTPAPNENNPTKLVSLTVPQRVLIREGYLSLVVEDTHAVQTSVEKMMSEMEADGAYVVTSFEIESEEGQLPSINMVIRVPAARFDEVMDRIAALAMRVQARTEKAEDVTEEYVDLQERLESMEAARERLRGIMKDAQTVEEMLLAEQQLMQREAEIESLKGRLEYLTKASQLSKVEIKLLPSVLSQPVVGVWQPGETARKAYSGLVKSVQGAVNGLIYFAIVLLPWLIVIGLATLLVRYVVKRYQAASDERDAPLSTSDGE